jgi:hypothetical protein
VGTYVDALFGHAGDARGVEALCRGLVASGNFAPLSADGLRQEWDRLDPYVLVGPDVRLYVYPKVALLHHAGVSWWDFARNARRSEAREQSRELARIFGAERILYLADAAGIVGDGGEDDLAADETFVRERLGPPTPWDAPPPTKADFRSRWFRESL